MQLPVIETDRLTLREFRQGTDFALYNEFYASDATRFYGRAAWHERPHLHPAAANGDVG